MDINDVINKRISDLDAGAVFKVLAANRERENARRNSRDLLDREFAAKSALQSQSEAAATQRGLTLLREEKKFSAEEGEKNRKSRLKEIETQARAYADRLSMADKQKELIRLRALGVEVSGKDIDEQLTNGLQKEMAGDYKAARSAYALYQDYEKRIGNLDKQLADAEKADKDYITKTARSLAESQAVEQLKMTLTEDELKALGGNLSADGIRSASKLPVARRKELAATLAADTMSLQAQAETALMSDKIDRPTNEALKALRQARLKAESDFGQFKTSKFGPMAMDRLVYERGQRPPELTDTEREPSGIDLVKQIMGDLNAGKTPEQLRPAMGERRMRDEELMNQPIPTVAPTPAAPSPAVAPAPAGSPGVGATSPGSPFMDNPGYAYNGARNLAPMTINLSAPSVEDVRGGIDRMFAPLRDAGNAVGDWARNVDAKAASIWGPDAVPLLKEAEKIATQRGMDPAEQKRIFDAAIGGDTNAQQKVSVMLDFVRQARSADQTGAFDVMVPLMPGVNAPAGRFPENAPAPSRLFIGPR